MGRNITVSVGDMDMGRVMDTATDMAIAVGDFRGLRPPPLFPNRPPGTEFLEAETGGQESTRESVVVGRDRELKNRHEESPQKRPLFDRRRFLRFGKTGWWCAQSYANPSQRRFHTGNRGNPLFSAFFSQNGEFKSKGFRFPCV